MNLLFLLFLILPIIVALSCITDIYHYTIPNSFSLILIVSFFMFAFLNPAFDWGLIGKHIMAGLIILIFGFILFSYNILGGGDVKILATSGLWIGLYDLSLYLAFVGIVGGALSIFLYLWRKTKPLEFYKRYKVLSSLYFGTSDATQITTPRASIPYAVAIFAGLCWTLPNSFIFSTIVNSIN
jgi:prepilin peptidase CpaA